MIDQYFLRPSVIRQSRNGPLDPHLDGFAGFLSTQGYAKQSGRLRIRLAGDLSRWLEAKQLSVQHLYEMRMADFLKTRRKHHRPNAADKPALAMLLAYLRQSEVIKSLPPICNKPVDEVARQYAHFLA